MQVSFSPVKEAALAAGRAGTSAGENPLAGDRRNFCRRSRRTCVVIIAYGQIIPARLLPIPKLGWINLHASLLPKYRGAAPINWAIVNGETARRGLTTMRIDAGMDTGEMLLQTEMAIGPRETTPELAARMAEAGAPLMVDTLRGIAAGTLASRAQNHARGHLRAAAEERRRPDRLDDATAQEIYNRMRGFTPWPGAYTTFRGTYLPPSWRAGV